MKEICFDRPYSWFLYATKIKIYKNVNEKKYQASKLIVSLSWIFHFSLVSPRTISFIICFAIALFVSFLGIGSLFPVCSNHWSAVLSQLPPCSSFCFCSCAYLHFWECRSSVQNLAMITSVINPVGTLIHFHKVY